MNVIAKFNPVQMKCPENEHHAFDIIAIHSSEIIFFSPSSTPDSDKATPSAMAAVGPARSRNFGQSGFCLDLTRGV